ncbi:MAG TPA: riboflavin kinase, partial [Planctomycetia bacterium]|nr:riboflavin kinase [Planctomycetia bacterium]
KRSSRPRLRRAAGIDCEIVPLAGGDFAVSSSRIRAALHDGDLAFVRRWLGRPHRVRGVVARGAARGRTIGFPTANLSGVVAALPADGVYAVRALLPSGEIKGGAANLGPNPTFQAGERKFEVHLFDFAGDLYDAALDVEFLARLRGVRQFSGVAALVAQIAEDCERARVVLAAEPAPAPGEDLARTIEEWTRHEVAEHLAPLDGEFLAATFIDAERLALRFRLPDVLPPPTRHELDFALPDRLRRAFPEIRDVEIAADR